MGAAPHLLLVHSASNILRARRLMSDARPAGRATRRHKEVITGRAFNPN